jgi:hypothetical protein
MQEAPFAHSLASSHMGAASPGVRQKPPWHTVAPPQSQQSALVRQDVRHAPFTHIAPAAQSAFF